MSPGFHGSFHRFIVLPVCWRVGGPGSDADIGGGGRQPPPGAAWLSKSVNPKASDRKLVLRNLKPGSQQVQRRRFPGWVTVSHFDFVPAIPAAGLDPLGPAADAAAEPREFLSSVVAQSEHSVSLSVQSTCPHIHSMNSLLFPHMFFSIDVPLTKYLWRSLFTAGATRSSHHLLPRV